LLNLFRTTTFMKTINHLRNVLIMFLTTSTLSAWSQTNVLGEFTGSDDIGAPRLAAVLVAGQPAHRLCQQHGHGGLTNSLRPARIAMAIANERVLILE